MVLTSVSFVYTDKIDKKLLNELRAVSALVVNKLKLTKFDISIIFVGESKIRQLNNLYRKKDKVTDVLSFFYGNEGEVFVCLQQARRQAKENKTDVLSELIKLVIHGLVHIAGYDHDKDTDYKKMKTIEDKLYDQYKKNN